MASQAAEKLASATDSYQGMTLVMSVSPLFLSSRGDFSRRGICCFDFSATCSAVPARPF
jgi:hypothetical protein